MINTKILWERRKNWSYWHCFPASGCTQAEVPGTLELWHFSNQVMSSQWRGMTGLLSYTSYVCCLQKHTYHVSHDRCWCRVARFSVLRNKAVLIPQKALHEPYKSVKTGFAWSSCYLFCFTCLGFVFNFNSYSCSNMTCRSCLETISRQLTHPGHTAPHVQAKR